MEVSNPHHALKHKRRLRADEPAYWRKAEVGANEKGKSRLLYVQTCAHTVVPDRDSQDESLTNHKACIACTAFKGQGMPASGPEPPGQASSSVVVEHKVSQMLSRHSTTE